MLFKNDQAARAQHNAVRTNIGWYKWTHDLVEVKGKDAAGFLDYLYVNAIAKAGIGRSKYTTMLNDAGQIIDDVIVTHIGEDYYWISTLYAPQLIAWMDQKKDGRDVTYQDITSEVDMYAVQGPNSRALINSLAAAPVDEMKRFMMIDSVIDGIAVKVHKSGFTGEEGYEIYCAMSDSGSIRNAIVNAGKALNAAELTILEVYVRSLPVEKGFALRQDLYGLSPYEADLDWSVDLSKDFAGKEAVLRVKEEGPQYKLVGIEYEAESYEDIAQRERVYYQGVDVGFVRAAIYGYTADKNIGFAVVESSKVPIGSKVTVGENHSPAKIVNRIWV